MQQLTGAEIVIECLKEQGVDTVFGYPGGAILNVYDALYKHSNEIKHGPLVAKHTPTFPVALAYPSAACAAP